MVTVLFPFFSDGRVRNNHRKDSATKTCHSFLRFAVNCTIMIVFILSFVSSNSSDAETVEQLIVPGEMKTITNELI